MRHFITLLAIFLAGGSIIGNAAVKAGYDLFPRQKADFDILRYEFPDTVSGEEYNEIEFDDWGFPIATPTDSMEVWVEPFDPGMPISRWEFAPIVYEDYIYRDSLMVQPERLGPLDNTTIFGWLDDFDYNHRIMRQLKREFIYDHPQWVRYNINMLPEPPKHYNAVIDPITSQIVVRETLPAVSESKAGDMKLDITRRNWLTTFNAGLQFSQAYISPNWYQGGNNNLNFIANIFYNVKLNEAFHKNLLFDTTIQYKLGLNSAPEDSLRSYSISEDLLQITSKFGYRAARRWFYSLALSFKTQLLNSYVQNSTDLRSAFLSPGELNIGAGMTYEFVNPSKTFKFNASISPISWNMKTCLSSRIDETGFGIAAGRHTTNDYGSSTELLLSWKIAYNITYTSRLFAFTDYDYFQGDWEHTINFDINRFLSTRIYAHMRYDTTTPRLSPTNKWHKFQFKEILSFGFSYSFSTK